MIAGTPQKVDDYMKSLLTDCKDGGMMIYPGADGGISGEVRPGECEGVLIGCEEVRGVLKKPETYFT